ncbi:MAG: DUF1858 domain-containing protein [Chloroflexi bacterium]|nr:DUF1858 domain-containing protein [Chloroflexota bacterium]
MGGEGLAGQVGLRRGFAPLKDEALRRTMATRMTIQQVCAMHSVDLDSLLRELNEAATAGPATPEPAPAVKTAS